MTFKAVFHFNRIVAKRSVFVNTQAELIMWTQCIIRYVWLRYAVEVENGLNKSSLAAHSNFTLLSCRHKIYIGLIVRYVYRKGESGEML